MGEDSLQSNKSGGSTFPWGSVASVQPGTDIQPTPQNAGLTGFNIHLNLLMNPWVPERSFMKIRAAFLFQGVIAALLIAPNARAACTAQPLTALSGTWVFSTEGFSIPYFQFLGSAGSFTATTGVDNNGLPVGNLTIVETEGLNGSIARVEPDKGHYQLNDACTGGTLNLFVGSRPEQFDFFFINSTEMVLVGSQNGDAISGSARLRSPLTCTASPLAAIAGTWVFRFDGFDLTRGFPEVASAGRFTATGSVLDVVQTGGVFGGNVRYEPSRGTIQVTSDCSGGSMTFALSGRPMLFDYYFADPNRIVLVGSIGGDIITGTARRFGTQ